MSLTRRDFLKNSLFASLAYSIPPFSLAYSKTEIDHFFVQILASGGMDVTLSLDPLHHGICGTDDKDIFLEYRPDQIIKRDGLILGPACESLKATCKV